MTKQELFERNNKIINEVLKKIERTCPNSVDMVAIGGSFASGDYYDKSDLDIVIIRNNDDAINISKCFIMDDIGYDIYTQSWDEFIRMARYTDPYVTKLKQLDIIYTKDTDVIEKYKNLQADLNDNMNNDLLLKNNLSNLFSRVSKNYSDLLSGNTKKESYMSLGNFIENTENIIYLMNRKYIDHGVKTIPLDIINMKELPKNFINNYYKLFSCANENEISDAMTETYNSLEQYLIEQDIEIKIRTEFERRNFDKPDITSSDLTGTFEELYSNYYNKLKYAYENNDRFLSFRSLVNAQKFYDYFNYSFNINEIDIVSKYNPNDLKQNFDVFVNSLKEWKKLYDEKNKKIQIIDNPKEIYDNKNVFTTYLTETEKKFFNELDKEGDDSITVTKNIVSEPILDFTVNEAIEFSKENRLDEWLQLFLREDKKDNFNANIALADGINFEERFFYGPVEFDLEKINPVRIEENLVGNELKYYKKVVDRMENDFNGNNFPPLILEYKDDKFYLTDGNHRYSALRNLGVSKYYSIIWGNKELENKMKNQINLDKKKTIN